MDLTGTPVATENLPTGQLEHESAEVVALPAVLFPAGQTEHGALEAEVLGLKAPTLQALQLLPSPAGAVPAAQMHVRVPGPIFKHFGCAFAGPVQPPLGVSVQASISWQVHAVFLYSLPVNDSLYPSAQVQVCLPGPVLVHLWP